MNLYKSLFVSQTFRLHLSCAQHCCTCFTSISSFHPQNRPMSWVLIWSSSDRWRNWGREGEYFAQSHTQLSGRARIRTQVVWLPSPCIKTYTMLTPNHDAILCWQNHYEGIYPTTAIKSLIDVSVRIPFQLSSHCCITQLPKLSGIKQLFLTLTH